MKTKKCTHAKTKYSQHIQSLSNLRKFKAWTEIDNIQDFCIKKTQWQSKLRDSSDHKCQKEALDKRQFGCLRNENGDDQENVHYKMNLHPSKNLLNNFIVCLYWWSELFFAVKLDVWLRHLNKTVLLHCQKRYFSDSCCLVSCWHLGEAHHFG